MRKKLTVYCIVITATLLSITKSSVAQDSTRFTNEENARVDSLARAYSKREAVIQERKQNSENLSELKVEKQESKAKAREAQRIERDANDAAKESKMAYRQERKAQKARARADRQSRKAANARSKSEKNENN